MKQRDKIRRQSDKTIEIGSPGDLVNVAVGSEYLPSIEVDKSVVDKLRLDCDIVSHKLGFLDVLPV